MNSVSQKTVAPWPLVVVFIVISVSAILMGFLYYNNQKENSLINKQNELSAIADLKVRQISQWRRERIANGTYLSNSTQLIKQFSEFISNNRTESMLKDLRRSLKSLVDNYDYKNVLLLDSKGEVKLFYPDVDTVIGDYLKPKLPGIIQDGKVVLNDLHKTGKISFVHLDLLVPLKGQELNDTSVLGVLLLRIDPREVLYPLIQSWPLVSKTAESLLIRREGDEIIYLNELRHLENTELILRKSVSTDRLPAALALQGINGITDGIDYRGVPVVAAMKKVPGSPWYMVAKVDREEVLAYLHGQISLLIIIIVLFILATGATLGFFWWNHQLRFYREKYETELDRLALIKHFDYILKYANDIILLVDNDFVVIEANDRAVETYQYERKDLIGLNMVELCAPESLPEIEVFKKLIDKNGFATFEIIVKRKNGSTFPIEISARKVDIEGEKYYQAIGRDITERKHAEEILRESEEKFRKIFEESPFGIVISGKDLGFLTANSSFSKMVGLKEEELFGLTFRNITHPDYISNDEISILRLIAGEIPIYHTEKKYLRSDGSVIWGSTTVSLIRNNDGEVQFFIVMVEDITSRKKAEADLIAAKEKAEESDRLKTAFLHNVSHEIRTPMNAIIGFSTLLTEPDLSESDYRQFTDIIIESGNQLLSIINDIVDLASIETGQVKINIKELNINAILRGLSEQYSYKEKLHNVTLSLKTPLPDNAADILTDKTKLVQIISNLINNAFKFTKNGKIEFGYHLKDKFLEFFVKDTGIGIPHQHHEKIFDRFYQVDSTISRHYTGTGLGLSICKAYTTLLGGEIHVDSKPEKGSIFTFTLPYTRVNPPK